MIYSKLVKNTLYRITTINPTKVVLMMDPIEDEKDFRRGDSSLFLNKSRENFIKKHTRAKGIIEYKHYS
jgi:hypothetical protein